MLNIPAGFTDYSFVMQFDTNHPIVGETNIVCDTKYYTAVRPLLVWTLDICF